MMRTLTLGLAAALATAPAYGHAPSKGPNGGQQADAGDYHVEMLAKDKTLDVYVRDHEDKPVPSKGFKGLAILVLGGKPQRIPLAPAEANRLSGTSPVALPAQPKGVVQLTTPEGIVSQAKY